MSEYLKLGGHISDARRTAKHILDGLRGGKRASQIMDVLKHLHAAREALDDKPKVTPMTDAQIKHMVDRFLGWKLPRDTFNPDCGISFDKKPFNAHTPHPSLYEPTGTNLFDATQANAMVRYIIEGLPSNAHT